MMVLREDDADRDIGANITSGASPQTDPRSATAHGTTRRFEAKLHWFPAHELHFLVPSLSDYRQRLTRFSQAARGRLLFLVMRDPVPFEFESVHTTRQRTNHKAEPHR